MSLIHFSLPFLFSPVEYEALINQEIGFFINFNFFPTFFHPRGQQAKKLRSVCAVKAFRVFILGN